MGRRSRQRVMESTAPVAPWGRVPLTGPGNLLGIVGLGAGRVGGDGRRRPLRDAEVGRRRT